MWNSKVGNTVRQVTFMLDINSREGAVYFRRMRSDHTSAGSAAVVAPRVYSAETRIHGVVMHIGNIRPGMFDCGIIRGESLHAAVTT